MDEQEVKDALKKALKLPSGNAISSDAVHLILGKHKDDKDWIKSNFSAVVEQVQVAAYLAYLEAERPAASHAMKEVLAPLLPEEPTSDDFFDLIQKYFGALDKFFLGLTQGRRPRAGKAFEQIIRVLFEKLGYPYTPQAIINGQPDFLLPSVDHFRDNPMDCVIFTVKRTLRERWRQITTEGSQGLQFFLATIDDDVATRDLPEMLKNRIYMVVPSGIKEKPRYADAKNVISFETFFEQHLDPAMARWRANGIIAD